ncbi:signal peptidase II [Gracilimonas sediminicola]|uniref:Lipoprotein signal peptidase n=1 Tax=Gracilimonas sediminicola TaxID=2952158 RepID=A0A9X2L351_9BACT|nr:signal peptidase II [Gracilimonas sediminicola]MCP9291471.1 signal peptidase II [Gracilimonas sediminicola]
MTRKKLLALLVPAVIVLAIDQITKWLIRTTPELQNKVLIDGWLQFYFTKNPGMALGIDVLSTPVISVIAILAVTGILIYILRNLDQAGVGYLVCMGLIIGGAFGNITDRLFMGLIMDYGGVLEGHVVDFIYFSLQIGDWTVFPYIFNVADIAISCSIILLLLFNKRFFITQKAEEESSEVPEDVTPDEPTKQEGII